MPDWLPWALQRIRACARGRTVLFTLKARRELAGLALGLDESDACDVLARLVPGDSAGRVESAATGEWLYLFQPSVAGTVLCLNVVLRVDWS